MKRTGRGKPKRKPPKLKAASKTQHARFVKAAGEFGANETAEGFERTFRKLVPPKLPRASGKEK